MVCGIIGGMKRKRYEAKKSRLENIEIACACGCGSFLLKFDREGRERKYVSGHNGRKYSDPTQYKREWNHRNRQARYQYKSDSIERFKVELMEVLGGKCLVCGFKFDGKNSCVFDFHHREPKKRKYLLCKQTMNRVSRDVLRKEAEKCDLLCSNCHRLLHSERKVAVG